MATPERFVAVGQAYRVFTQTSDEEVLDCLTQAAGHPPPAEPTSAALLDPPSRDQDMQIRAGQVSLSGHLTLPENPIGLVAFAHGSGSSRHSPRNRYVATILNEAGIGTLLLDLLTTGEELDRATVFDIPLLAARLLEATAWVHAQTETAALPAGYFGASTGAGAALWAAAEPGAPVAAVVSRGGRPDLAGPRLAQVSAPTLLIVGGHDPVVLDLNHQAQALLHCPNRLLVIPGASHMFQESGTLHTAAEAARDWFTTHLTPLPPR